MTNKKIAFMCVIIAATACFVGSMVTKSYMENKSGGSEVKLTDQDYETIKDYLDLIDLENIINNYYYDAASVDKETLVNGALKGMVEALGDKYSVYYDEDEYTEYTQQNDGTYVGIGASVTKDENTGYLVIMDVVENGPAYNAGIVAGQSVTKIDNTEVKDLSIDDLSDLLKGPVGSTVNLTVLDGETESVVEITREEIQGTYVYYSMLDDDLAYINITEFHGNVSDAFAEALKFVNDEKAKGIVLDLRNNLGGLVDQCIGIADQILPEGVICKTVDKDGNENSYEADSDYNDIPIIVLVNGSTASSSEILAAAIQDEGRGKLVGTETRGKGVVQSVIEMPYSGGSVKLTTSVYYTPNGRTLVDKGLTPDVVVELPEEVLNGDTELTQETDTQLITAKSLLKQQLGLEEPASGDSGEVTVEGEQ